jgi:hypothetical protein
MNLTASLKDKMNRTLCWLDATQVGPFASKAVDDEMAKAGWKITHYVPTPLAIPGPGLLTGMFADIVTVHNPRGQRAETAEQRREYLAARREAARAVYGLK